MAPRLPERYELRIRLGRDIDIVEWLATDTSLDRPVLVRILDPGAGDKRKKEFVEATRAAAAAHHVGLSEVYALGSEENPYAVVEWHGGVSVADRLRAGETLTVAEFLSIGPRLASGLAALHGSGGVHGGIDTAAIGFSGGQPAKLGAFGRHARDFSPRADTASLAAALRVSVTGSDISGIRPSQVAEGLPQAADGILHDAERGTMTASVLAGSLRALRVPEEARSRSTWSWKWTGITVALVAAALIISAAGVAIEVDPKSPFLYPAVPQEEATPTPIVGSPHPADPSDSLVAEAVGYDPTGEAFPNQDELALVLDESRTTAWRSDSYAQPLRTTKPGLGIAFTVTEQPRFMEVVATQGTGFEVLWADRRLEDVADWQRVYSGTALAGPSTVRLPDRSGGVWMLWITDLPLRATSRFFTDVYSVKFLP